MQEVINSNVLTCMFEGKADVILFAIAASNGGSHITGAQADAARDAAKAVLEVLGADVVGNSTADLISDADANEETTLTLEAVYKVTKNVNESDTDDETETNDNE